MHPALAVLSLSREHELGLLLWEYGAHQQKRDKEMFSQEKWYHGEQMLLLLTPQLDLYPAEPSEATPFRSLSPQLHQTDQ